MVQRLTTAHTALAEDPSLIPSIHITRLTIPCNSSSRGIQHLWLLLAPVLMLTLTITQVHDFIHTHTPFKNNNNNKSKQEKGVKWLIYADLARLWSPVVWPYISLEHFFDSNFTYD